MNSHKSIICKKSQIYYLYSLRTANHFARFTLDSDRSPHILYSTYSTHCLFTLVVNYLNYNSHITFQPSCC